MNFIKDNNIFSENVVCERDYADNIKYEYLLP